MVTATNVDAHAVGTIAWLSAPETSIVVPVYQRQYRWDIGGCEQLLSDVRAVADLDDGHTHFLASILSSKAGEADDAELVLIDGQQRVTTLMLLVAALAHTVRGSDPDLAAQLQRVLVRDDDPTRTRLRPHRAWASVFERVVLGQDNSGTERSSRFDDNYAFFRSQIRPEEAQRIWRGLSRLEHVAINLGAEANAQQIFESLNSTGEPLRDHELIHNYVLMGLSHAEQGEIEQAYWLPIEQNTGESIGSFWRHYLVMRTGREVFLAGERGVYDAFRHEFPLLDLVSLRAYAAEWKEYSEIYRVLLDPAHAVDDDLSRHLGYMNTFGRASYPLIMPAYRDYTHGACSRDELVDTLEHLQSMLLRRTVVGIGTTRLIARLCRARLDGTDALAQAIARIMPSDERVRISLKYGALPHPAYVLGRLAGVDTLNDLVVEHVFPPTPGESWSGDGQRAWSEYTEDEQNSHRALADTLGNLTLLEESLADRVFDSSFPDKRDALAHSQVGLNHSLAATSAWGTAAIAERTEELLALFVQVWPRRIVVPIDDDGLTPILDAQKRRGWPRGWQREFAYVEYCDEHWEVPDVKYLFNRIFKRLWADAHDVVADFSARRGGPIYDSQAWNGQWDTLDPQNFLYMGWDAKYMLTAIQEVLTDAGLASEVFVKYSHIGEAMDD